METARKNPDSRMIHALDMMENSHPPEVEKIKKYYLTTTRTSEANEIRIKLNLRTMTINKKH